MFSRVRFALALLLAGAMVTPASALPNFIAFDTGLVRPVALSPNGQRLFAANAPDNTLEILKVGAGGVAKESSVTVGLEPVAVAALSDSEVWVVNHLSDSVSIVDVSASPPRVVKTLLVGDEPRDIVFADPDGNGPLAPRAFITTAHRGQHRTVSTAPGAGDPQLTTPGIGRADVWVFDTSSTGAALGGNALKIVVLFGDTPRGLAVKQGPGGATVYASILHSGNQSTTVTEGMVCNGFGGSACAGDGVTVPGGLAGGQVPGGLAAPSTNNQGVLAPETGLIAKLHKPSGQYRDKDGRNFTNAVRFTLPDKDVFAIDANSLNETAFTASVGTTNFNLAVNPVSGKLYVSNTEANNLTRFEGPGCSAVNPVTGFEVGNINNTVNGKLALSRISVVPTPDATDATGATVQARHLNKHIDYSILSIECDGDPNPAYPVGQKAHSLATPVDMVVDSTGTTLYVAAYGSSKVGVFSTTDLENDTFTPNGADYITVSGGGPAGIALDEARGRLYVLTRFDNAVKVVNTGTKAEIQSVALNNPETSLTNFVEGRRFLYDAALTSGNGEASCSSCHIFGDKDELAWDLGNPDDHVTSNPMTINLLAGAGDQSGGADNDEFHPMKGPMTTQTLRGMSNSGAMHWRGDRSNGFFGINATNEDLSFRNFIVAFPGLVGSQTVIASSDMQKFADFQIAVQLPPNPVRNLDNSLTTAQAAGRALYVGTVGGNGFNTPHTGRIDGVPLVAGLGFTCEGCHRLDANQGFFGTGKDSSFENETQIMKIPHLRNMYTKVGMFGMPNVPFNLPGDNAFKGDQIRGFGFLHDGSTDTLFRFFTADVFNLNNNNPVPFLGNVGFQNNTQRQNMELFMLAFDADLAPITGQQVTRTPGNAATTDPRVDLIHARSSVAFTSKVLGAGATENDVVVTATVGGVKKGWVKDVTTGANYQPDDGGPNVTLAALKALSGEVTFTAVPPGSGRRIGIDRDLDGDLNGQDNCADVANASQSDGDADLFGDACDNCALKANGDQADTDVDAVGDLCDNSCGFGTTTLASVSPGSAPRGAWINLTGTGVGPSFQVKIGGVNANIYNQYGTLGAQIPGALADGSYLVEIVNPEGCRSQEVVNVTVAGTAGGCGLTGIEAFAVLGMLAAVRRMGRKQA